MTNFEEFGQKFNLSEALNKSLLKMDYKTPTPIQEQAIPLALKGHDILGSAQTGTGKTAAFSIPLVEALMRSPNGSALVLTPTRELAKQVLDVIYQLLGPKSGINTAFIIGGEQYGKQMQQLRNNPRIVVGTPGRINDHLRRGSLTLKDTGFLVLDETDRMLDMGFGVQLDEIVKHLPEKRQTLMFSATMPKGIIAISAKYLNNPQRVSVGETNVIATNIKQEVIRIEQGDKYRELQIQLNERQGSVIVFVKTKHNADKMAKKLREDGFTSEGLHGDLRQNKRDKVMKNFRDMNFRILVATDIAARGLDVPHIEHVINYDLPQVAEDYIHRMGRTARAGATGSAISFVASQDSRKWYAIERLINPDAAANDVRPPAQGKNKGRNKPYRGRPEGNGEARNNNSAPRPQKRKEKYVAKADKPEYQDRPADGSRVKDKDRTVQGNSKPFAKPHFKKKKEFDPNAPENKFVSDRKPKKNKPADKSGKFAGKPSGKATNKGNPAGGDMPMKKRNKTKVPYKKAA